MNCATSPFNFHKIVCIQTDGATLCQLCQLAERTPTVAVREHSAFLPRNLDWEGSDMLWTCQAPWALQKESVVFVLIFMNECRERQMNHDFCSELARMQQPDSRTYTQNICLHSLPSSYKATRRDTQTRRKMCRVKIYGWMKWVGTCMCRFSSRQESEHDLNLLKRNPTILFSALNKKITNPGAIQAFLLHV